MDRSAPAPLVAKLDVAKQAADLCTGALDQRIVFEAWKRGVLDRQVPMLRAHYQQKRDVMERALQAELGDLVTWPEPRGGFFLWVTLPAAAQRRRMLPRAIEQQGHLRRGQRVLRGRHAAGTCIRLSFSLPPVARIEEGIRRLTQLVRKS